MTQAPDIRTLDADASEPFLSCSNLSFLRGPCPVLDDISFTIDKPQFIGIIGPNGAGKTTLMRCLAGLVPANSGRVELEGQQLDSLPIETRSRTIALLPQDRQVHWSLTCREIVMLGRMPYRSGFARSSQKDRQIVADAMAQMDVANFAERDFHCLSGGEQARILIARMLAQQPRLMIADEPVNGLDPAHQIALMQTFRQIVTSGTTVIASLHDLSLASRWCDRLLLLNRGRLVADDAPKAVLSDENMASVFGVRMAKAQWQSEAIALPVDLTSDIDFKQRAK